MKMLQIQLTEDEAKLAKTILAQMHDRLDEVTLFRNPIITVDTAGKYKDLCAFLIAKIQHEENKQGA